MSWIATTFGLLSLLILRTAAATNRTLEEASNGKNSLFQVLKASLRQRQDLTDTTFNSVVGRSFTSVADLFIPNLERSHCLAWDSCVLRCGDPILGAPYLCSCDANCVKYDDCCVDYTYYCGAHEEAKLEKSNSSSDKYECRPWFGNEYYGTWFKNGIYTLRKCVRQEPSWCNPEFKPSFMWDYTQSLSILLNFGPEGWNNNLLFSSDFYDPDRCPAALEIWDPFTEICRPIECSKDFEFVDGKCVWDGEGPEPPSALELLGFTTKEASITFRGNILLADILAPLAMELMRVEMGRSLAQKIRIGQDRFSSLKIMKDANPAKSPVVEFPPITGNETIPEPDTWHLWVLTEDGFPVTVNFTLQSRDENSTEELTIEQFLSVLHEAVTLRGVLRTMSGVPMKINAVEKQLLKEEITFFETWCKGGDLISFWNEEFQVLFILKDALFEGEVPKMEMAIKVKDTGKMYNEGHYVANLLYQSTDLNAEAANLSGVVMVCENRPQILDPSCTRWTLNLTECVINEDNSITYEGEMQGLKNLFNRSEYEYTEDGNIRVCIDYEEAKAVPNIRALTTAEMIASFLTLVLTSVSLLGLLLTLITYVLFSELRTLPGWCLIHFALAKFVFFFLFITGARPSTSEHDTACVMIAISLHFFALLFFSWSAVISYDLYITFTQFQSVSRSKQKYLRRYSLIGYGLPFLIVFTTVMVSFHADVAVDYGKNVCWIGNSMAALYVFAVPIATAIVVSLIFFILAVRGIRAAAKQVSTRLTPGKERKFFLFVRMSSFQCFAWIFGFLAVLTPFSDVLSRIFEFTFLILSALQGLYIFAAFVCNERVKKLYRLLLRGKYDWKRQVTLDERSGAGSMRDASVKAQKDKPTLRRSAQVEEKMRERKLSGNRNAVAGRTVSNETCVSFVSM